MKMKRKMRSQVSTQKRIVACVGLVRSNWIKNGNVNIGFLVNYGTAVEESRLTVLEAINLGGIAIAAF